MSDVEEKALLAGGCFWGMQELIRSLPGVVRTRVGYTGDSDKPHPTYRDHGRHAESIEIVFDPSATDYRTILEYFFQIHDPTTRNRQGNDVGLSYRSAIFYVDDEQQLSCCTRNVNAPRRVRSTPGKRASTALESSSAVAVASRESSVVETSVHAVRTTSSAGQSLISSIDLALSRNGDSGFSSTPPSVRRMKKRESVT
jgi:methionine-S-sulfoxide reductase